MTTLTEKIEQLGDSGHYEEQAKTFLKETNATITKEFFKNDHHFGGDDSKRDIYNVTIKRSTRSYVFQYGQSINGSKKIKQEPQGKLFDMSGKALDGSSQIYQKRVELITTRNNKLAKQFHRSGDGFHIIDGEIPSDYDILACLTKYDPGTFESFCSEFGYEQDSRRAEETYNATKDEYNNLCRLFSDEEIESMMCIA